ncbi:MAG: UbiA family prenyltransferase [Pseudonocardiaceae bacterium]
MSATAILVRRGLLKCEAVWWMSRTLLTNLATWTMVMGWVVADPELDHGLRLAALYVAIVGMNGALFMINDILDAEGDAVTAPYLPLPSGLLTLRQTWIAVGVTAVAAIGSLALASGSTARFGVNLGLVLSGIVLSMVYSKVKDHGLLGSITVAVPQSLPAVIAWVAAGGGAVGSLLLVLAYCLLASVSNNILAGLRDIDRDPEAGNRTLAVRIGAPAAFRVAAILGFTGMVPVVMLAMTVDSGWWAAPYLVVAAGIHALCYPRLIRCFAKPERGRTQRLADLRLFKLGEYVRHSAVVAAFNPIAGLVTGVFLYTCLRGGYTMYNRRLVNGRISRSLTGLAASR